MDIRRTLAGLVIAGCMLALPSLALAIHPLILLEDSLEMDAQQGRWPEDSRGQMVLVSCAGCARDRYPIGADAEFLLAEEPVDYRTLVSAIRSGRYTRVFVAVSRATGAISRVRVLP